MLSIALNRNTVPRKVEDLPVGSVFTVDAKGLEGDIFMSLNYPLRYVRLYSTVLSLPLYTVHDPDKPGSTGFAVRRANVTQDFGVLTISNVQEGAQ